MLQTQNVKLNSGPLLHKTIKFALVYPRTISVLFFVSTNLRWMTLTKSRFKLNFLIKVQYIPYFTITGGFFNVLRMIFYGLGFSVLANYRWGRHLLLKVFSIDLFCKIFKINNYFLFFEVS